MGGGERVLQKLHALYPDAPIYTSVYNPDGMAEEFKSADIRQTWLRFFPFKNRHQFFAVLRPFAFRSFDFSDYDVVITSDAADAKNIRVPDGVTHICYCHTPIRYYWSDYEHYLERPGFGILDPLVRLVLKILVKPLRRVDYRAAQKVDYFMANSKHIQKRIKKYYGRDSEVVYPPVNVERFKPSKTVKKSGFVHVGRMNTAKRIDLIVEACNQLKLPLTVAGRGTEWQNLEKLAGPTVKVTGELSDDEITDLIQKSEAFIFAAEEDFGITPVEAMSAGTPVIAYGRAGVTESVIEGKTGMFFKAQTVGSIVQALKKFKASDYKQGDMIAQAAKFSEDAFALNIKEFVNSKVERS